MFSVESQQCEAFEDLTVVQNGWEFTVSQLGPSKEASSVSLYRSEQVSYHLLRCGSAYDQSVNAATGWLSFGLLEMDAPPTWLRDRSIPHDGIIVFPVSGEGSARGASVAGFCANGINLSEQYLAVLAERVYRRPLVSLIPDPGIYRPSPPKLTALRSELRKWRQLKESGAANRPAIVARREESLAMAVLDALADAKGLGSERQMKSDQALGRAMDYIYESELENISAVDICTHAGCSQRTLENTFKKRIGVSPKKFIKYLRIAQVNRGLRDFGEQNCDSIIELASMHGFWHMGQFAADYQSIYGELPSQTLLRR